ncbi:MAG: tetratricopeptide repeat protein, partial [Balneolaceae bacterium]|nr:tetratricopeptide repeat protein [Balneolaceae bacterium]
MKYIFTFVLALFLVGTSLEDARKANDAYEKGNYEKAITLYKQAIQANSQNAKLYFNLGNALAKNGSTEEAVRYFEQYKQMTDDPAEKAKADYNIGNIYAQNKKWGKATQYYKNAMRRQSDDIDAKH